MRRLRPRKATEGVSGAADNLSVRAITTPVVGSAATAAAGATL